MLLPLEQLVAEPAEARRVLLHVFNVEFADVLPWLGMGLVDDGDRRRVEAETEFNRVRRDEGARISGDPVAVLIRGRGHQGGGRGQGQPWQLVG